MTPDERSILTRFLDDLSRTRASQRDPEAADLISRALAANPDGAYVLVQHAVVADQSLHAAQARIAELEDQLRAAPPNNAPAGFLAPARSPWSQGGNWQAESTVPQGYQPMPPQQRPSLFSAQSGLGSFLRSAGTTAAGVAGGEMLFSGIRDLFGGGLGGGREEVINNYYDDDNNGGRDFGNDTNFDTNTNFDDGTF